ncbi:MAG: arsenate reductase (glutaredoxin) [Pseudomonadales bacterium]
MSNYTIFHNPRCSKSRQTLALLEDNGVQAEVRLYLDKPPTVSELKTIVKQLELSPRDLLRKGEEEYKSLALSDPAKTDTELLSAMATHPRLIERPIVIKDDSAVLGRPPENVLTLL